MGFGLSFDPFARKYRMTRPGISSGGSVAVDAFVDANGDGLRQLDEAAVANVVVETPAGPTVTGPDGRVVGGGLGDAATARLRVNLEGIDDPFLVGPAQAIDIVPRPGRTAVVLYPMLVTSEVELTIRLVREDQTRALAAVDLQLIPIAGGAPVKTRTDHAGVAFVEGLRPGPYRVELDPDQARDLGLTMVIPVELIAPAEGGFVRGGDVLVRIDESGGRS